MSKRPKKSGKPKSVEAADANQLAPDERPPATLEQHLKELHGDDIGGGSAQDQEGMPSLASLKEMFQTKSAAIRYLASDLCPGGPFPVKRIAKLLGVRYQHARNVAKTPLKRGPNEDWRPKPKAPTDEST